MDLRNVHKALGTNSNIAQHADVDLRNSHKVLASIVTLPYADVAMLI